MSAPSPSGVSPPYLNFHRAVIVGSYMVLHSGCDSMKCSDSVYAVSLGDWVWKEWTINDQATIATGRSWMVKPTLPQQATGAVMAAVDDKVSEHIIGSQQSLASVIRLSGVTNRRICHLGTMS